MRQAYRLGFLGDNHNRKKVSFLLGSLMLLLSALLATCLHLSPQVVWSLRTQRHCAKVVLGAAAAASCFRELMSVDKVLNIGIPSSNNGQQNIKPLTW